MKVVTAASTFEVETAADAKRAARAARRAAWRPTTHVSTTAADVKVGDFLVVVRHGPGYKGATVDSTVTAVETTHDEWGQRGATGRKMTPVEGRRFTVAGSTTTQLTMPATAQVVVRRTEES